MRRLKSSWTKVLATARWPDGALLRLLQGIGLTLEDALTFWRTEFAQKVRPLAAPRLRTAHGLSCICGRYFQPPCLSQFTLTNLVCRPRLVPPAQLDSSTSTRPLFLIVPRLTAPCRRAPQFGVDKFDKEYAYNVRHNYGKEGKRTVSGKQPGSSRRLFSCMRNSTCLQWLLPDRSHQAFRVRPYQKTFVELFRNSPILFTMQMSLIICTGVFPVGNLCPPSQDGLSNSVSDRINCSVLDGAIAWSKKPATLNSGLVLG